MPVHPYSGIATVTVFTDGTFEDPQAGHGTIGYGGHRIVVTCNTKPASKLPPDSRRSPNVLQ
jgi:hypothetical protein